MIAAALPLTVLLLGTAAGPPAAQPVDIQADLLVADAKRNRAVFTGNVRVVQEGYVLTCRRLVVTYGEARRVRTLVADGDVRVLESDRTATAERAELDNARRLLTLTGEPVLTQGESVLRGEVVVFDLASDEVRVEQVRAKVKVRDLEAGRQP